MVWIAWSLGRRIRSTKSGDRGLDGLVGVLVPLGLEHLCTLGRTDFEGRVARKERTDDIARHREICTVYNNDRRSEYRSG